MNWQAGPAGEVAERLRAQFDATIDSSILKFHPDQHVSELIPGGLGSVRAVNFDGVRVPFERRVMANLEGQPQPPAILRISSGEYRSG